MSANIHQTNAHFRTLFQQADIYDHSSPQRTVWMLVEKDVDGVAVHIFLEKPPIEVEPEGFGARLWRRASRFVPILSRRKPALPLPYIPYASAIVGIQIHIHDNKIESVLWDPVPGEDDFQEDPDLPENPTVQVIIDNIDAYRPIVSPDGVALDGDPERNHDLDDSPF
jgi:hypothetical protein